MKGKSKIEKICVTCVTVFNPWYTHLKTQKLCSRSCARRTDEFKSNLTKVNTGKISISRGKPRPNRAGVNSNFWRGGVSEKNRTERQNFERDVGYVQLRRDIFHRDNYTCQVCGDRTKVGHRIKIQIDHVKPYLLFPELRMEPNNLRTICVPCHYKTDTYGAKVHNTTL